MHATVRSLGLIVLTLTSLSLFAGCGGDASAPEPGGLSDADAKAIFGQPTGEITDSNALDAIKRAVTQQQNDFSQMGGATPSVGASKTQGLTQRRSSALTPDALTPGVKQSALATPNIQACFGTQTIGTYRKLNLDYDCMQSELSKIPGGTTGCTFGGKVHMQTWHSGNPDTAPVTQMVAKYTNAAIECTSNPFLTFPFTIRDCSMTVRVNGDPGKAGSVACSLGTCTINGLTAKVQGTSSSKEFCYQYQANGRTYFSVDDVGGGNAIFQWGTFDSSCKKFLTKWKDKQGDITISCDLKQTLGTCDVDELARMIQAGSLINAIGTCVASRDPNVAPPEPPLPKPVVPSTGCKSVVKTESMGTFTFDDATDRAFITNDGDFLLVHSEEQRGAHKTSFNIRVRAFNKTQASYTIDGKNGHLLLKVDDKFFSLVDTNTCKFDFTRLPPTDGKEGRTAASFDCTMNYEGKDEKVTGTTDCRFKE